MWNRIAENKIWKISFRCDFITESDNKLSIKPKNLFELKRCISEGGNLIALEGRIRKLKNCNKILGSIIVLPKFYKRIA